MISRQRLVVGGIAALVVLSLASGALTRRPDSVEAIDTTGEAPAASGASVAPAAAPSARASQDAAPDRSAKAVLPGASASVGPSPVPIALGAVQVSGRGPLILLNPSTVRPGSAVGIIGGGFDPSATIDIVAKRNAGDRGDPVTFVQSDKGGSFGGVNYTVPPSFARGDFIIEARQRKGDKVARATGIVASTAPSVKLGIQVGKPGEEVALSAQGFAANEDVKVYWNAVGGDAVASFRSDGDGAIPQAALRVPFGAVGQNSFVFVGASSQAPVTMQFQLLSLFPVVTLSDYAIKADNELRFTGKDFGPSERVLLYFNTPDGPPLAAIQAGADGTFTDAGGIVVPFGLKGQQTLVFVGEQSRAPATVSFDILGYTPNVQPSTYGGRPGTAVSFYAQGFARSELVKVFVGRTSTSPGRLVSCFRTDDRGSAGAAGSYVIGGSGAAGQLLFSFVGGRSGASTTASVEVMASDVAVQLPQEKDFTCTLEQEAAGGSAGASPSPSPAAPPTPTAGPSPAPAASASPAAIASPAAGTYVVAAGDSLAAIAVRFYGDADQWTRIYDANKAVIGDSPSALRIGMTLVIPPKR